VPQRVATSDELLLSLKEDELTASEELLLSSREDELIVANELLLCSEDEEYEDEETVVSELEELGYLWRTASSLGNSKVGLSAQDKSRARANHKVASAVLAVLVFMFFLLDATCPCFNYVIFAGMRVGIVPNISTFPFNNSVFAS